MFAHVLNITFTLNVSMENIRTRATTRRTVATHTLIILITFFLPGMFPWKMIVGHWPLLLPKHQSPNGGKYQPNVTKATWGPNCTFPSCEL